jgi:hypothetical protein
MEIYKLVDQIESRQDLIEFLKALRNAVRREDLRIDRRPGPS